MKLHGGEWKRPVEKLVRALEKRGIRVREVYVFGSRVRGDWLKTSDIDVVIVSEDFRGLRFLDRLELIERVEWEEQITPHIEAIPLTPEELEERKRTSIVLRDAQKYWVRIVFNNSL